jgi:hypothetical protein
VLGGDEQAPNQCMTRSVHVEPWPRKRALCPHEARVSLSLGSLVQILKHQSDLEAYKRTLVTAMRSIIDSQVPKLEADLAVARRQAVDIVAVVRLSPRGIGMTQHTPTHPSCTPPHPSFTCGLCGTYPSP